MKVTFLLLLLTSSVFLKGFLPRDRVRLGVLRFKGC